MGLVDYSSSNYVDWILRQVCQVVLLVNQIQFTKRISTSLVSNESTKSLKTYFDELVSGLNKVASMNSKDLPNYKLLTIEALITIEVHSRDILYDLIEQKINKIDDFEWRRHLKYEWDDHTNSCMVIQSDATFNYGYEYLGCSPRLVITPLTDRCFLTLTGALKLNLGGAPAGPAGTGKTETVKDLAKSVGKLCLVFNCSEGLDYKMLGRKLYIK
jgi:dynein heavy chain